MCTSKGKKKSQKHFLWFQFVPKVNEKIGIISALASRMQWVKKKNERTLLCELEAICYNREPLSF